MLFWFLYNMADVGTSLSFASEVNEYLTDLTLIPAQ